MIKKAFGITMQTARKRHGITQKEFAKRFDIAPNAVNNYELGYTTPSLDKAVFISKVLGFTIAEVLEEAVRLEKLTKL